MKRVRERIGKMNVQADKCVRHIALMYNKTGVRRFDATSYMINVQSTPPINPARTVTYSTPNYKVPIEMPQTVDLNLFARIKRTEKDWVRLNVRYHPLIVRRTVASKALRTTYT